MAESESIKAKTWKELFEIIKDKNLVAKCKKDDEGKAACNDCKSAIFEIIERKYGNVSLTFGEIAQPDEENHCKGCTDAFRYAQAMLGCRIGTLEEIQKKYCTDFKGCAVTRDGLLYIDPNEKMPG